MDLRHRGRAGKSRGVTHEAVPNVLISIFKSQDINPSDAVILSRGEEPYALREGKALLLTHDFQVTLRLQVFDSRVIHQADDGDPVVLPSHLQHQLTGHRVHVGPLLHFRLACRGERAERDDGGDRPPRRAASLPLHPPRTAVPPQPQSFGGGGRAPTKNAPLREAAAGCSPRRLTAAIPTPYVPKAPNS